MAKGYKKYTGHEYKFTNPASSGLGKELSKQKSSAQASKASDAQTLAKGGEVKDTHDKKNLNQLRGSFDKFLKEEGKEHPKKEMSHGAYMADGGQVSPSPTPSPTPSPSSSGPNLPGAQSFSEGLKASTSSFSKGGEAKKEDNRKDIGDDNKAGSVYEMSSSYKKGGKIPGKAKVKGDSIENDTVDIKVSPGEDVLPRSVTKAKNAPEKAKKFVKKLQEEEKDKKKK